MKALENIIKEFEEKMKNKTITEEERNQLDSYIQQMCKVRARQVVKKYGGNSFDLMMAAIFELNAAMPFYYPNRFDLLDFIMFYMDESMKSLLIVLKKQLPMIPEKEIREIVERQLPLERRILSYYYTGYTDVKELAEELEIDESLCATALGMSLLNYDYENRHKRQ